MRIDTLPFPVMAPEQIGTRLPVLRPRLERRTSWCTLVTLAKNLPTDEDHVEDVRRVLSGLADGVDVFDLASAGSPRESVQGTDALRLAMMSVGPDLGPLD